ncbi:peptide chain release factor N(5)-glutamine methyltransferase [Flavobacterium sp. F372]|uniref:Release factor glutamine methyltransferase n=1 Tax=Flavobacterium bernardetii TaxID=2813823 RepID=A0ABR7IUH3_9FLAO|nr:peptide chain release factor N(5)-glutamine methyltransferase [Flavobacterium bernardetii]MBC5833358.1 peptide chain release factor N(5)-glutamine methyltransferase [Flavobacterium bernardetii]NHF68590.1 peptide chain release factor N(5)-glutamine methyltransferase [Flavobacterium bernardetii]
MQIKNLKKYFFSELQNIQEDSEIESFFFILTEYLHDLKRIDVSLNPDFEVSEADLVKWNTIISELKTEKPIQYITGETWFYGYRFEVNENTLIPRPETEELVEWIIESQKSKVKSQKSKTENLTIQQSNNLSILDIGTGSGCIPISLKKEIPNAIVSAIDVSEKALEMAKKNAFDNEVEVNFMLKNILETDSLVEKYDVIVSNPPYVRNLEKQEIKKNVLDYEPHLALFVEDTDALLFYRKIAELALTGLTPKRKLFFEINQYLGKETVELLENLGFKNIELRKDFVGNDRMICCEAP